jgi:hypothetical protein
MTPSNSFGLNVSLSRGSGIGVTLAVAVGVRVASGVELGGISVDVSSADMVWGSVVGEADAGPGWPVEQAPSSRRDVIPAKNLQYVWNVNGMD